MKSDSRLLDIRENVRGAIRTTDKDIAKTALLAKGFREAGQTAANAFRTFADKPEVDYSQKEQKHPITKAVLAPMKTVKKMLVSMELHLDASIDKLDNLAMNVQLDKEKHMENAKTKEQTEPERAEAERVEAEIVYAPMVAEPQEYQYNADAFEARGVDEVKQEAAHKEALQSEEARRAEEIAERKRKSSKKSTQKRNQKRAEIKAKAEAGDPEAMAEYKAILEKGRQNNRKRSEKMRELRMSDPEYRAKMEEKERLALEREKKRQERATKKKKIALAELKEQAEKGNQEAVRELEERRAIARERSRKSAEKRKQRAENDPEYAKYLEERNAEYNRRHTARRKEQMEALRARAEAGDQEAQSQLAERKQYQVRATVKSYRKMREDALNGDPIAKERYEKTLAMRREAYHAKKSEQTA